MVVLYSAEREAGEYLNAWNQGIRARLPPDVLLNAVADLGAVPFFVPKNAIIKQLALDYPNLPILLDWKGSLGPLLSVGRYKTTASLFIGGRMQSQVIGEYSTDKAAELLGSLLVKP